MAMNWRLIRDGAASGAWNMAVDEALLLAQLDESTLDALPTPVLRFYDWNPPCLSLGRLQKIETKYFEAVSSLATPFSSLDFVRRPTGGRAVWHQHEITYCAVLRAELLPTDATSVVGSYRWLSEGLLAGLQTLGIKARLSDGAQSTLGRREKSENCFDVAAPCDAVVDGRKLIGAAQCRKNVGGRTAILQHGSLLLDVDETAWKQAMQTIGQDDGASLEKITSLRMLGVFEARATIIDALCEGMTRRRGVKWSADGLSAFECEIAQRLYEEKYRRGAKPFAFSEKLDVVGAR